MLKIFSIYDKKAELYGNPFYFHNEPVALRNFGIICNDPQYPFQKFPDDYAIYCIGLFEETNAQIEGTEKPEKLVEVISLMREDKKNVTTNG